MLPNNSWSSEPQVSQMVIPHTYPQATRLVAHDLGPKSIGDITAGLGCRIWTASWDQDSGLVMMDGSPLFTDIELKELSLTFDQAGKEFIAFQSNGVVKIWWYDPLSSTRQVAEICSGDQPFCHLDIREPSLVASSDIVLVYRRGSSVFYRLQRDRFLIERNTPLADISGISLRAVAMATNNRLTIRYRVKE